MKYYYYKGNWIDGKQLLIEIEADNITTADNEFKNKFNIDPRNDSSITVTLQPLNI